jgi:hypothetical protein
MAKICIAIAFFALLGLILYTTTLLTLLKTNQGLQFISEVNIGMDSYLLTREPSNPSLVSLARKVKTVMLSVPTFAFGFSGDRVSMFDMLYRLSGNDEHVAFGNGVFTPKYNSVYNVTMSKNQPRGQYISTLKVPDKCLGSDTLIFLNSTSTLHSSIRQLLVESTPSLSERYDASLHFDDSIRDTYDVNAVRRTLIRTLFYKMFRSPLTSDQVTSIMGYFTYGATCVLGEDFHKVTFGLILNKVNEIRDVVYNAILNSQAGDTICKIIKVKYPHLNTSETIMQFVDGFLFAGLLGSEHLVTHALDRVSGMYTDDGPIDYDRLWLENSTAFLLEHARLDPPVTSVTSLVPADTGATLQGKSIKIVSGTPNQLGLSTANRDPTIWGGKYHSKVRSLQFDPSRGNLDQVVSWNGPVSAVKIGMAPRGCPAHNLSLSIAESMVEHFRKLKRVPKVGIPMQQGCHSTSESITFEQYLSNIGYAVWGISCFLHFKLLGFELPRGKKDRYPSLRSNYRWYLLFQVGVAVSYLYGSNLLWNIFALSASLFYLLLYINQTSCSLVQATVQKLLATILYLLHACSILLLSVRFGISDVGTSYIVYPFYCLGSLCTLLTIYTLYRSGAPSGHDAFIGGVMGLLNILLSCIPIIGVLLSRLSDTVLYVPNVIPLVTSTGDCEDGEDGKDRQRGAARKHRYHNIFIGSLLLSAALLAVATSWVVSYATTIRSEQLQTTQLYSASRNFQLMYNLMDLPANMDNNSNPLNIKFPEWEGPLSKRVVYKNISVPYEDEDLPKTWLTRVLADVYLDKVYANGYLFPIVDSGEMWSDLDEAKRVIGIALSSKYIGNSTFEVPYSTNLTSDGIIEQLSFAGLGAVEVKYVGDGEHMYACDFSWMHQLEVRSGFYRYGATAYFNASQNLVGVYMPSLGKLVKPGDQNWESAKWVWKCSMLTGVTLKNHLVEIHMLYANLLTTIVREYLPRDHPLRRLIKPFNYKTVHVNYAASHTLLTEYGMLHRSTALSWQGLSDGFDYLFSTVRYNPYPERFDVEMAGRLQGGYPFGMDGIDFYYVVHRFVSRYINEYYPEDSSKDDPFLLAAWKHIRILEGSMVPPISSNSDLIKMVANYIVYVTGIHRIVGDVEPYLLDPSFMSSKIRPNIMQADVETSAYSILIAKSTITNPPKLMNDFTHLLLNDEHYESNRGTYYEFQRDLENLASTIEERNMHRRWKFNGFNPKYMASSVSS